MQVRSHGPAKAAVTALTTAARAARARAAASKLMEEGQSAHLSNGSKHITHVEIHPAPCLAVDSGRGMAFEMVSPKTKGTAVPPSAGHQQQCIGKDMESAAPPTHTPPPLTHTHTHTHSKRDCKYVYFQARNNVLHLVALC